MTIFKIYEVFNNNIRCCICYNVKVSWKTDKHMRLVWTPGKMNARINDNSDYR